MAYNSKSMSARMNDYMNLRSLPAAIGIVFTVASLYLFGAITGLTFGWGVEYQIADTHALWVSLGAYLLAFASSETRSFDKYDRGEQAMIAAGPLLMLLSQHWTWLVDTMAANSPHFAIVAFLISFGSYAVLVQ
ncbi:hypothetical protein [Halorubrum sp. DTA46]|uniref:hypothetical protein n=1 Tax=Halorubrum sp. DTA46 TaxID=3402162 RepID=UPI003AB03932